MKVLPTPEQIAQAQLDAYNERALEKLLQTYAEDAELYQHPAVLLAKGHAELRERFAARFQEPNLHARLIQRIVMAEVVVDQEIVTRNFPEGLGELECIMIYEVANGRIQKAWSIAGKKTLS